MDESYRLKIEYVPLDRLKPYERNARKHGDTDIDAIAASIKRFGFKDPIGVWGKDIIVEGHGRLLAAKKLNLAEVPIIRLDDLTDEERRMYALAHNKTAELSAWDFDTMDTELEELGEMFDVSLFGFLKLSGGDEDDRYTTKMDIPQYQPTDDHVFLSECYNTAKYEALIDEIENAQITNDEKVFLKYAAARHLVFEYKKIAEYYANKASEQMQSLMEKSALVIIDYGNAIANGFVKMSKKMQEIREKDYA